MKNEWNILPWTLCRYPAPLADRPSLRWCRIQKSSLGRYSDVVWPKMPTCANRTPRSRNRGFSGGHPENCKWLPPLGRLMEEKNPNTHHEAKKKKTRHKMKSKKNKDYSYVHVSNFNKEKSNWRRCILFMCRVRSELGENFWGCWRKKNRVRETKERKVSDRP
jgi:hypothetical protein